MNRGFTVVELLTTLVVMTILLTLGATAARSALVDARDTERADDIAIIARGLERYYKNGNPFYTGSGSTKGTYPGANTMLMMDSPAWCTPTSEFYNASVATVFSVCKEHYSEALPGVSSAALTPPDKESKSFVNQWISTGWNNDELITSWMQTALNDGKYVYKPMNRDSYAVCLGHTECTRFALFYKKESTGEIVTVWSKNQQ